jgi:hypothetical protein
MHMYKLGGSIFSLERSSTGSNDCFVVLVVLVVVLVFYPLVIFSLKVFLCRAMGHFVPSRGTLDFLCRPVAHFVPSCGTLCAFPWHISLKFFLCRAMAHFVPSRDTWYSVPSKVGVFLV